MPRKPKMPRSKLIECLTDVFLHYGFDGTALSALSEATGLSKASLYHHFPGGKDEMAAYVLARLGARLQSTVIAPLKGPGTPAERLAKSLDATVAYYGGSAPACVLNILSLGSGHNLFGAQLQQGVGAWIGSLETVLREGGLEPKAAAGKAREVMARIQGALVLCRVAGNRAPLDEEVAGLKSALTETLAA